MKKIGVLANCRKPQACDVLKRLATKARELDLQLFTLGDTAGALPGAQRIRNAKLPGAVDVLLALGGDGTMLRAIRMLEDSDTPVLGVNLGSLGFMTSVTQENLEHALEMMARGSFTISERAMAACHVFRGKKKVTQCRGLNDVVIGWGSSSRIVSLELSINQEPVTSFNCDGLIVSTPTGSTGHSLSAGGAILHPETPAFVISPICPHTLSNRPIVIPDSSLISVLVAEAQKELILAIDGQEEILLKKGDRLEISRSPHAARFIHLPGYSYFSVLRQKLHWRGSSV
ncbi:MAG: NAD(+)/NADH kinase [Lentisphaerota bacterium]